MPHSDPKTIVSTSWLAESINAPGIHVLDASWYLPSANRDGQAEFDAGHIAGAQFFDIDEISDQTTDLPHMVPSIEMFASRMRALGIADNSQVVVYDGAGLMSAARVWWLFRLMGMENIAVLEGGLPKWISEGRDVTDVVVISESRHLTAQFQPQMIRDANQVLAASLGGLIEIIDARPAARFNGSAPEPREGLRSGHIPNSRNVFFMDLLEGGIMKPADALRDIFIAAGVDLDRPAITTCGSGVTAAVLSLALERIGHTDHALYDGSWSQWGLPSDLPVATGD